MTNGAELLAAFRAKIAENNLDGYLVFHMDAHQSEYLAPCDERIAFISGFTGSNGICFVSKDKAVMWTDGRYYLQAEKQLYEGWEMMKMREPGVKPYFEWIKDHVGKGATIGLDESQVPASAFIARRDYFKENEITLKGVEQNLVDAVWTDRPARPQDKVWILEEKYAGESAGSKFEKIAKKMKEGINHMIITALDDLAWILNLRGTDISYNPIFFAYGLLHRNGEAYTFDLFIDGTKVSDEVIAAYLKSINVAVHGYGDIEQKIKELGGTPEEKVQISVNTSTCNHKLYGLLEANNFTIIKEETGIIEYEKSVKNKVQQEGMRQCNIRDCAAIMKYFAFLEEELKKADHGLNEFSGARKVEEYRTFGDLYKGPSFDTISSIGPNGAVIHYKPEKDSALALNNDEIYLLDSGGQYLDGTTDITRTAHFSGKAPTAFQKEAYTRVLMGNLDLEMAIWPQSGTYNGGDFDFLARKHLFEAGLDYKHGTGHGVGSCLCVHEGPIGVSKGYKIKFVEGMCVSDEPGYYQDGEFGIRIENVIMVQPHPTIKDFFYFENLTTAPYCRELIDVQLLPQKMVDHLNTFYAKCLKVLEPLLAEDPRALDYVRRQCAPLSK